MAWLYSLGLSSLVFDTSSGNLCCEIEPPQKIRRHWYRCDNKFHLDTLYEQTQTYDGYGVVLLSGNETKLYLVEGPNHKLLSMVECRAKGKQGRGGQSQQRFERLRLEDINDYHKKIHEKLKLHYINHSSDLPSVKGLIFAGPAQTKNKVAEHDMFDYRLKEILTRMETTGEIKEGTIIEVIDKISDLINSESDDIKDIVFQFTESIRTDDGLSIYGYQDISYCMEHNLLHYLIASNHYYDLNHEKLDEYCEKSGCQLVITISQIIETYGGIVGLAWYPVKVHSEDDN